MDAVFTMSDEPNVLPKTSPQSDWLALVVRTISRYGHRDVTGFVRAVTLAKTYLGYSQELPGYAENVREFLVMGQARFTPDSKYFDATVAVEYATLLAKFNSIKP